MEPAPEAVTEQHMGTTDAVPEQALQEPELAAEADDEGPPGAEQADDEAPPGAEQADDEVPPGAEQVGDDINGDAAGAESATEQDDSAAAIADTDANGSAEAAAVAPAAATETVRPSGYRLFVANVPKEMDEDSIRPVFEEIGEVTEVSVLKQVETGQSTGQVFITYRTKEAAEAAISQLHKKRTLDGHERPIEVDWSRNPAAVTPGAGPPDNKQVFFSKAPHGVTDADVRGTFGVYGGITDLHLFTDRGSGVTQGCGVVTYEERENAVEAIKALDGKVTMLGAAVPLIVRWHDPDLQSKKRKASEEFGRGSSHQEGSVETENKQLFFARVPRLITEQAIEELFKEKGHPVHEVVLFKVAPTSNESRGCGLLNFETHEDALAALEALNGTHTWQGMAETMVLKWGEPPEKRRKQASAAPAAGGYGGYGYPAPAPGYGGGARGGASQREGAPPGCDPDAIRLFVGGIPKEAALRECEEFFGQYGKLVDFYLVRDRHTRESRGIAYVWYAHRQDAEAAMAAVHDKLFLAGHENGSETRPMSVSKAQPRPAPALQYPQYRAEAADPYASSRGRPAYSGGAYGYSAPQSYYPPAGGYGYQAYPQGYSQQYSGYGYSGYGQAYSDPNAAYAQGYYQQPAQPAAQQQGGYQAAAADPSAGYAAQPAAYAGQQYAQQAHYGAAASYPAAGADASAQGAQPAAGYQQQY